MGDNGSTELGVRQDEHHILQAAQKCAASALSNDTFFEGTDSGQLQAAASLLIRTPEKKIHSVFTPLLLKGRILGYFIHDLTGAIQSHSKFGHIEQNGATGYQANNWLDPDHIKEVARSKLPPHAVINQVFLSFDKVPDRLAWRVESSVGHGTQIVVFVAGDYAYISSPPEN